MRLQRVMAAAGVASRRECETLIEEGHVTVNGKVVRKLPVLIDPDADQVHVDGRPLRKPERRVYIMVNKPARILCTTRDDPAFLDAKGRGRPTILDLVSHPAKPRLFPVGRLDFHTTGLVLLTNDGELANKLTHPRHGVPRTYEAMVRRSANEADLNELARESVRPERGAKGEPRAKAVQLSFVKHDSDRTVIRVSLTEGPNRSVPDVLARLGFHVKRLERVAIGPLELSGIPVGGWRELTRSELIMLKKDPSSSPKYRERTIRSHREIVGPEVAAREMETGERASPSPGAGEGGRTGSGGARPVRRNRNTPPPQPNSRGSTRGGQGRKPGAGAATRGDGAAPRSRPTREGRGGRPEQSTRGETRSGGRPVRSAGVAPGSRGGAPGGRGGARAKGPSRRS